MPPFAYGAALSARNLCDYVGGERVAASDLVTDQNVENFAYFYQQARDGEGHPIIAWRNARGTVHAVALRGPGRANADYFYLNGNGKLLIIRGINGYDTAQATGAYQAPLDIVAEEAIGKGSDGRRLLTFPHGLSDAQVRIILDAALDQQL